MNKQPSKVYTARIDKVCDYIQLHLDDDLSVDKLSQIALFSKYHFHRLFASQMGINVARYILITRLKRACRQLAFSPELRVIEIAMSAGFENPESFARAFKNVCGQTPSQFRQQPSWAKWNDLDQQAEIKRIVAMNVEIVQFAETKVAVKQHRGSHDLLKESIDLFIGWRLQSGLSPVKTSASFGIAYDDPQTTPADDFRFDICGSVKQAVPENEQGVINSTIPAGRCAKVRHLGSHDGLRQSVYYLYDLYGQWLVESGEQLRDFPCFFHYLNLSSQVDESELITDVYLPLN